MRRNGHPHLALPADSEAARHTLALYQPQRTAGKLVTATLFGLTKVGLHRQLVPSIHLPPSTPEILEPALPTITPGTCGILLGSPEHHIRRAIASYRTAEGWEVAKIALGADGEEMLTREAATLTEFSAITTAAPPCLGLHRGHDLTILRMPRIAGTPVAAGSYLPAIALLDHWVSDTTPQPASAFPEFPIIATALVGLPGGLAIIDQISALRLTPVLRHGDFARWNLLAQSDGQFMALDWEWGGNNGMPGLDLVHYFLQDARLVSRLDPTSAITATIELLRRAEPAAYLAKTGWPNDPILPIIASLAYKQGANQQDNQDMLTAALGLLMVDG